MPEFCTCGSELPPDARFCHRCGKPQREEIVPETVERSPQILPEIATAAAAAPTGDPPRVNFRNRTAVRIGLLLGCVASLLSAIPAMAAGLAGLAIWWAAAGFLSVHLYRRRTGQFLGLEGSLRMGWITGVLGATVSCVLFTASMALLTGAGKFAALYHEQMQKMYGNDANAQAALKSLENPSTLVVGLLFSLLLITLLCTAGGALGAVMGRGVSGSGPKAAR